MKRKSVRSRDEETPLTEEAGPSPTTPTLQPAESFESAAEARPAPERRSRKTRSTRTTTDFVRSADGTADVPVERPVRSWSDQAFAAPSDEVAGQSAVQSAEAGQSSEVMRPRSQPPTPRGRRERSAPAAESADDVAMPGFRFTETPAAAPSQEPAHGEHSAHPARRAAVPLDEDKIDPDVQKVIRRLTRSGYEAYLVGGCVRDLLLDRRPKDFDVATSARPEEVRALFRNSQVIGRRFRLVHVRFHGGKVIEVATFRRKPVIETNEDGEGGMIRSDNVFGEAHEDALRRDFTINALFYDLDRREILDWVGGLEDIERRVVNTIGDPVVRFREDPVRILRALKFAGRLDLGIAPHVYDAIVFCRGTLELAARARVAEEVLRLLRGGRARRTIFLAWETGVLELLLPELAAILYDSFASEGDPAESAAHRIFRLLEYIDNATETRSALEDTVLWTLLLLEPLKEAADGSSDPSGAAIDLLEPMMDRLAIPRRFSDGMRRILQALPRILAGKVSRFAKSELFGASLDVAEADLYARNRPTEAIQRQRQLLHASPSEPSPVHAEPAPHGAARLRPRRRVRAPRVL